MPLDHGASAAVYFTFILNYSHSSQSSSILNSSTLSYNMVLGTPKMAIQFFIKASAV